VVITLVVLAHLLSLNYSSEHELSLRCGITSIGVLQLEISTFVGSQVKAEDARKSSQGRGCILKGEYFSNIFHTRCLINGNVCLVIIDGESCTNVVSSRLASKMNMDTKPHLRPYKLQWLSEGEEVQVKQ